MAVIFVFDNTQTPEFFGIWLTCNALFDTINLVDVFVGTRLGFQFLLMDDQLINY